VPEVFLVDQIVGETVGGINFERRVVAIGDGQISYIERKGRGPVVVFFHANGFNAQTYTQIFEALPDNIHLIAPDLRGHGQTTLNADPLSNTTWKFYGADAVKFIEALKIDNTRGLVLAGHSMGGTTSLMTALAKPHLPQELFLVDPVLVPKLPMSFMRLVSRFMRKANFSLADSAERRRSHYPDKQAIIDSYQGRGAFTNWPSKMLLDYVDGGVLPADDGGVDLACKPAWEAANYRSGGNDVWQRLRDIRIPVTLYHGDGMGVTCPPPVAKAFARRCRKTDRRFIPGASHFLLMEHPDLIAKELGKAAARAAATAVRL
jgi:pimeloyl-ACP methyl ester carboxylesterase